MPNHPDNMNFREITETAEEQKFEANLIKRTARYNHLIDELKADIERSLQKFHDNLFFIEVDDSDDIADEVIEFLEGEYLLNPDKE